MCCLELRTIGDLLFQWPDRIVKGENHRLTKTSAAITNRYAENRLRSVSGLESTAILGPI